MMEKLRMFSMGGYFGDSLQRRSIYVPSAL